MPSTIATSSGEIFGHRDFFHNHGYLPEVASIDADQTPTELLRRLLTLRTYVTRYSQKLKNVNLMDEQLQTYTEKRQQYQTELHQVEQLLTAMSTPYVIQNQ